MDAAAVVAVFRRMHGKVPEPAVLTRPGGTVLAANVSAVLSLQCTEELLKQWAAPADGDAPFDVQDPRHGPLEGERQATGAARGRVRLRRPDGSAFEADVSTYCFLAIDGSETHVVCWREPTTVIDAVQLARESEQRLGFALDAADIGDCDMDLRTNVARRSLRHDRCFGYTEPVETWGYDTFLGHVYAEDRARVDACYRAAMAGEGEYDVEFRVRWPDACRPWRPRQAASSASHRHTRPRPAAGTTARRSATWTTRFERCG